jgi:hypothetical protein
MARPSRARALQAKRSVKPLQARLGVAIENHVPKLLARGRPLQVVVARDGEDQWLPSPARLQPAEQGVEKTVDAVELLRRSGVRQVAGQQQQIRRPQPLRQGAHASLQLFLDLPPQVLPPAPQVQVGQMQPTDRPRTGHLLLLCILALSLKNIRGSWRH